MNKLAIGPALALVLLGFSTTSLSYQNEPTAFYRIAWGTQLSAVQGERRRHDAASDGDLMFIRPHDDRRIGSIQQGAIVCGFHNGPNRRDSEVLADIIAQNNTNQDLSRPVDQRHSYATRAYQQCMNYCGSMVIICNTGSDEDSVYTPPSELCETKFHNCEADCAASLKRQWGPSTSEQPREPRNGTAQTGGGSTVIGGGQRSEASDAVAASDQAVKDAKTAADTFERWYKTGHSGDLPKMKHYVAEAKAASDRARAIAAVYPNDRRLQGNAQEAELAVLRVQVLAVKAQAIQDAINQMLETSETHGTAREHH